MSSPLPATGEQNLVMDVQSAWLWKHEYGGRYLAYGHAHTNYELESLPARVGPVSASLELQFKNQGCTTGKELYSCRRMVPTSSMARLLTTSRRLVTQDYPPAFLAPFLHHSAVSTTRISQFSTTDTQCLRTRDLSRNRGVSALRRTGLRFPVEMSKETLPQPVLDPTKRSKVKVSKDHGLWSFFGKERRPINLAEEDAAFGVFYIA